jgi:hypothetical protein
VTTISICTPWHEHLDLMGDYERAVQGADRVIVSHNCRNQDAIKKLLPMTQRLDGLLLVTADVPFSFAHVCNEMARYVKGDIVMFLNNDIRAVPGWLDAVRRDVKPGALYGVATDIRVVDGQPILYLEGWCIAADIETWHNLGGWDAETFQRPYWEDVDLSWRATQMQIRLLRRPWMVTHLGNRTSATTPGAYDHSAANRQAFERKVRAARVAVHS